MISNLLFSERVLQISPWAQRSSNDILKIIFSRLDACSFSHARLVCFHWRGILSEDFFMEILNQVNFFCLKRAFFKEKPIASFLHIFRKITATLEQVEWLQNSEEGKAIVQKTWEDQVNTLTPPEGVLFFDYYDYLGKDLYQEAIGHLEECIFLGKWREFPTSFESLTHEDKEIFYCASFFGDHKRLEFFNAFADPRDGLWKKCLVSAVINSHDKIVKWLVEEMKVSPNCEVTQDVPLIYLATLEGHFESAELLLKYGADREKFEQAKMLYAIFKAEKKRLITEAL